MVWCHPYVEVLAWEERPLDLQEYLLSAADIQTPGDLKDALTRLREALGVSIRMLSRSTGIPTATLGGYFSGRYVPPLTQPETFERLLVALGVDRADVPAWREALARVRRSGSRVAVANPYRGLAPFGMDDADLFFGRAELVEQVREAIAATDRGLRWVSLIGASGSGKSSLLRAGVLARAEALGRSVVVVQPRELVEERLGELVEGRYELIGVDQFEELFAGDIDAARREAIVTTLVDLARGGSTVVAAIRADHFHSCLEMTALVPALAGPQVLVGALSDAELEQVIAEPARLRGREVDPALIALALRDARSGAGETGTVLPLLSHAMRVTWDRSGAVLTASEYLASGGIAGAIRSTAEWVWSRQETGDQEEARRLFLRLVAVDGSGRRTRRSVALAELDESRHLVEAFAGQRILTIDGSGITVAHEALFDAWPRLSGWIEEEVDVLRQLHRVAARAEVWEEGGRQDADLLRGAALESAASLPEPARVLSVGQRAFVEASLAHRDARQRRAHRRQSQLRAGLVAMCCLALVATTLSIFLGRAVHRANAAQAAAETASAASLSRQVALEAEDLSTTSPATARLLALAAYRISPTFDARSALLDSTSQPPVTRLLGPAGSMRAVYSPDGRWIAAAYAGGLVRVYERSSSGVVRSPVLRAAVTASQGSGDLFAAEFSPDGRLLAVAGGGGVVTMFDMTDPLHPRAWASALRGPQSAVQGLRFNADGTEIAAATSDPGLYRWRLSGQSATPLDDWSAIQASAQSVAFGRAGLVAVGAADGTVQLLHEGAGGALSAYGRAVVADADGGVFSLAFSPDGARLIAGTKKSGVVSWAVKRGRLRARMSLGGFPAQVNSVAFDADGARFAGASSGGLSQVWTTADHALVSAIRGPSNFTSAVFSPDGSALMTGALDGGIQITGLASPRAVPLGDTIWSLSYVESGSMLYAAVGSAAPALVPFDIGEGRALESQPALTLPGAATLDGTGAASANGHTVVAGTTTGRLAVFHPGSGAAPDLLDGQSRLTEAVAVSPDGSLVAAASDDRTVAVYRLAATGRFEQLAALKTELPLGVQFSPDGRLLAVGTVGRTVELYSIDRSVEQLATLTGFKNYVYGIGFSRDSKTLAAGGSDDAVRLWDISTPSEPKQLGGPLKGATGEIYSVQISPDARLVAAASKDGRVWLWSGRPGRSRRYAALGGLGSHVNSVAFDPHGGVVAGGGGDGDVALWATDPDKAAAEICASAGTPLTREEWKQFVPASPYRVLC